MKNTSSSRLRYFARLCLAGSIYGTIAFGAFAQEAGSLKQGSTTAWKVRSFTPAGGESSPGEIKSVAMPPNRMIIELNGSGNSDGLLEITCGHPLCLGGVSGCSASVERGADNLWTVRITGRQQGTKQMVELAKCRSADDAITPVLFKRNRHDEFMRRKSSGPVGILFLGDSITDWWPKNGKDVWAKFAPLTPANFGVASMRTEGLLWNITHGELDGINPKAVVILIGVNNILQCPDEKPEWVVAGISKIVETVREKLPASRILLMAVFPARNPADHPARARIAEINRLLPSLADGKNVLYLDIGKLFLTPQGTIRGDLMPDGVHPNAKGYQVWFDAMNPVLSGMIAPQEPSQRKAGTP